MPGGYLWWLLTYEMQTNLVYFFSTVGRKNERPAFAQWERPAFAPLGEIDGLMGMAKDHMMLHELK